jgi:DNA-binding SARP family transcriptional activator
VDRFDRAPDRLIGYLEAALQSGGTDIEDVATTALRDGLSYEEAAGLLIEAAGGSHAVLVVDQLERLGRAPDSWRVIASLVRHAPDEVSVVLISGAPVANDLVGLASSISASQLGAAELALTPEEAVGAFPGCAADAIDAAIAAAAGWVAGVRFGLLDPDGLRPFLEAEFFAPLDPELRELLAATAILDEVSPARASALGFDDAGQRIEALRAVHLPVRWEHDPLRFIPVGVFRRFLTERFECLTGRQRRQLRSAHVRLLVAEGRLEAAVDEALAAAAAGLAVDASRRLRADHLLLQALADVPSVCARAIDTDTSVEAPWRSLAADLRAQRLGAKSLITPIVALEEFGRRRLLCDGAELKPRVRQSYELLSLLASRRRRRISRDALLAALFEGGRDASARSYLRQAIQAVRGVLPPECLEVSDVDVALGGGVMAESVRFEELLAEASRLHGGERLEATRAALALYDRGPFLPGSRGAWADDRERELTDAAADARYKAAALALGAGEYEAARDDVEIVLAVDPYRESAWRLAMRICHATGDESGVLDAYAGCQQALEVLGLTPTADTRQLLERLRR